MDKVLDLMKRMGEDISINGFWDSLIGNNPLIINEGLFVSHKTDKVVKNLIKDFNLRYYGKEFPDLSLLAKNIEKTYIGDIFVKKAQNEEENITISLDTNEGFIKYIEQRLKTFGWALYRKEKDIQGKTIFYFEKRFPFNLTTNSLMNLGLEYIYHCLPDILIEKVMTQGLIPKESKSPGFYNEPRLYFWAFKEYVDIDDFDPRLRGAKKNIVLEIDLNKINIDHKFYYDGRMPGAIFSLEPIPPKAIKIIE